MGAHVEDVTKKAEELTRALWKGEYAKAVDLTHPYVVEKRGGREKMIAEMKRVMEKMKTQYTLVSYSVDDPQYILSPYGKSRFILYTATSKLGVVSKDPAVRPLGGKRTSGSFALGISTDGGTTWRVVVGDQLVLRANVEDILPRAIVIPEYSTVEVDRPPVELRKDRDDVIKPDDIRDDVIKPDDIRFRDDVIKPDDIEIRLNEAPRVNKNLTPGVGMPKPTPPQFQLDLVILQGDPLGSREAGTLKVLAESKLVAREKRPASFLTGGQVFSGGEFVDFGHKITVVSERAEDGAIRLHVVLEYTELQDQTEDSASFQTSQRRYTRAVKPGESVKLRWGKQSERQTWVELSVREVESSR